MRDIVVRKRAFDRDFVCSTYVVPEGNYRFTLEGCNEYAEGIIRNAKGDVVAILRPGESVDIARTGKYLICIEGRNAVGTIFTEWIVPPATDSKEYCCDELRATNEVLRTQIKEVKDKINNIQEVVVEAGVNVTVTREGNTYTVNAVDTIPDVDKAYVDAKIAAIEDKDTITTVKAGANVTVTQSGNDYTVSALDTVTTVKAGANVTVTQSGNDYTVNTDVNKAYVDDKIANIQDENTITTVSAGKNIGVTKSGDDYEVKTLDDVEFNKVELDSQNSNGASLKNTIQPISYNLTFDSEEDGGLNKQNESSTITAMNIQIKSKQELGSTSIKDRDVTISSDKIQFAVRDGQSPQGGSVLGLGNKTFDSANITSGRAATEDQLVALKNSIDVEHSSVSPGKNIGVTKNGNDYEVKTLDDVEFNKVELDSQNSNGVSLKNTIRPISYNLTFDSEEDGGQNKQSGSSTITAMNIQIKSKQELGTTSINDRDVTISSDKIQFSVRDGQSPQGGSVLGLGNKTFDPTNITSGRAATEDQLVALKNILDASDDDTIITISAGNGISVQKTGNNYEVTNTYPTLVAGSNVTLTPNSTNNTITISSSGGTISNTTVSAGKNIGVTKSGDNYEVKTLDNVKFNNVELGPNTVGDAQFYWRSSSMGTLFSRESPTQEQVISYSPYGFTGTQLNTDSQGNTETRNFSLSPSGYYVSHVDSNDVEVSKLSIGYDYISLKNNNNTISLYNGTITGLTNKTFDPATISSGRAATEDQLVALKNNIESNLSDNDTFHFTETSQGGIYRSMNFVDTQVYKNSMSLAQYDGTRNYGKSSIYLSEIDPTTRYYKFAEDYVPGTKQVVVSLEDIGFPHTDITVENILKYPVRYGGSFYNPTNAVIDNENKTITITINNSRNTNNGWLAGDKILLGTVNYGNSSFVTGAQNYGAKSVVAGNDITVNRGNFSLVVGNVLYNSANDAIVGGYLNDNRGINSVVSGRANKNLAERSFVVGNENSNASASASDSVVFGVQNENTKTNSFVFGTQNKNEGASSFVGGGANTNTGINSFVYGTQCKNTGMMNVLFGLGHDSSQGGGYLFACGYHSDITGNTLFAVGNGQESNKKNAFEVSKDGSIYLRSPNGTKYKLAVDDSGTLTVTPAT